MVKPDQFTVKDLIYLLSNCDQSMPVAYATGTETRLWANAVDVETLTIDDDGDNEWLRPSNASDTVGVDYLVVGCLHQFTKEAID